MRLKPLLASSASVAFALALIHCDDSESAPSSNPTAPDSSVPETSSPANPSTPTDAASDVTSADSSPPDAGPIYDDAGCRVFSDPLPTPAGAGIPANGLVLWLRADRVSTTATGDVCRWEDLSGQGHTFEPAVNRPSVSPTALRGRPAITFSAPDRQLRRSDVLGIAPTSARSVAAFGAATDTTNRFNYFFQGNYATNDDYWGLDQNTFNTTGSKEGVYLTGNAYDSNVATSTAPRSHVYAADTFAIGSAILANVHYDVDGVATTLTRTAGGTGNGNIEDFSGATRSEVGLVRPGGAGGSLGELMVYSRTLDATERAALHTYFQTRFPP